MNRCLFWLRFLSPGLCWRFSFSTACAFAPCVRRTGPVVDAAAAQSSERARRSPRREQAPAGRSPLICITLPHKNGNRGARGFEPAPEISARPWAIAPGVRRPQDGGPGAGSSRLVPGPVAVMWHNEARFALLKGTAALERGSRASPRRHGRCDSTADLVDGGALRMGMGDVPRGAAGATSAALPGPALPSRGWLGVRVDRAAALVSQTLG